MTFICALVATVQMLSGDALAGDGGGWTWPVRGPVLTAYRNGDDPYAAGQHRGVDIGAPVGSRVVAAVGGTVTFAGVVGSSGLTVSERTADGRFDLSYLHLSAASVRRGDVVAAGSALGAVGTSGQRSVEAPHLHFGVREAGQRSAYRDPLDFLAAPPAGDAPNPAPAPVPVTQPVPAEPSPAPAGPAAAPAPLPLPGLPAEAPAPGPAPIHGRAPVAAAPVSGIQAGSGASHAVLPRLLAAPAGPPRSLSHRRLAGDHRYAGPARVPGVTSSRAAAPSAPRGPQDSPSTHPAGRRPGAHGPGGSHGTGAGIDIGWLVACLGLVAVATALGHPDRARRAAQRGRAGLGALLRPAPRGGSAR